MDKPFKTIDEQVSLLESRRVCTDSSARTILMREGYYPVVNGYKGPFLDTWASKSSGHDMYRSGTHFSDIYSLFRFDRDLRMLMFRYFAAAEATLKTTCAYRFAQRNVGVREPYLDIERYSTKMSRTAAVLIDDIQKALGRGPYQGKRPKKRYLEHYVSNHDEVPVWVVMKYLSFGQASIFYHCLDESTRNEVCKSFGALYGQTHPDSHRFSPRELGLVYDRIKDFRNICAHDERLYCARVGKLCDIGFSDVMNDLALVLPYSEECEMRAKIASMLADLACDLPIDCWTTVARDMGMLPAKPTE